MTAGAAMVPIYARGCGRSCLLQTISWVFLNRFFRKKSRETAFPFPACLRAQFALWLLSAQGRAHLIYGFKGIPYALEVGIGWGVCFLLVVPVCG